MRHLLRMFRDRRTGRVTLNIGIVAGLTAGWVAGSHSFGLLVNWRALWIGAHYSPAHKCLCVNLLPGVTLWWTKPGGQLP